MNKSIIYYFSGSFIFLILCGLMSNKLMMVYGYLGTTIGFLCCEFISVKKSNSVFLFFLPFILPVFFYFIIFIISFTRFAN